MYCLYAKDKKNVLVVFAGVFTGVVLCLLKVFFTFGHRVVPFDLTQNFMHYLIKETLLPSVLVYGVYAVVLRDKFTYKLNIAFPLLAAFYAIYMPYCVIGVTDSIYSAYNLFIKPTLYGAMTGIFAQSLSLCSKMVCEKKKMYFITLVLLGIGVSLVFPAISQAMYDINIHYTMNMLLSGVFIATALIWPVLKVIKYIKE